MQVLTQTPIFDDRLVLLELVPEKAAWCKKPNAVLAISGLHTLNVEPWPYSQAEELWEAMGSDHNDGIYFHGKTAEIEKLWHAMPKHLSSSISEEYSDEYEDTGYPSAMLWSLGEYSAIIVYGPLHLMPDTLWMDSLPYHIVRCVFGSITDDMCLHETMLGFSEEAIKELTSEEAHDLDYLFSSFEYNITSHPFVVDDDTGCYDFASAANFDVDSVLINLQKASSNLIFNILDASMLKELERYGYSELGDNQDA